jgi:hypothetical protein
MTGQTQMRQGMQKIDKESLRYQYGARLSD